MDILSCIQARAAAQKAVLAVARGSRSSSVTPADARTEALRGHLAEADVPWQRLISNGDVGLGGGMTSGSSDAAHAAGKVQAEGANPQSIIETSTSGAIEGAAISVATRGSGTSSGIGYSSSPIKGNQSRNSLTGQHRASLQGIPGDFGFDLSEVASGPVTGVVTLGAGSVIQTRSSYSGGVGAGLGSMAGLGGSLMNMQLLHQVSSQLQQQVLPPPRPAAGRGRPSFLTMTPASTSKAVSGGAAAGGTPSSIGSGFSSSSQQDSWALIEGTSPPPRLMMTSSFNQTTAPQKQRLVEGALSTQAMLSNATTSAQTSPQTVLTMGSRLWGGNRLGGQ